MRCSLACWLEKFGGGLQAIVSADAVKVVRDQLASAPAAAVLSASSGPNGYAWLKQQTAGLRDTHPELPILMIFDGDDMAAGQHTALSLGLQGFIPLLSGPEVALAALRLVMVGGRYYPHVTPGPALPVSEIMPLLRPGSSGQLDLTPRERAVFVSLSEGLPNKLIARRLGMAVSTVKIHVHHILEKLNVQNRTEVAIWARSITPRPMTEAAVERRVSQREVAVERRASRQTVLHVVR
jgi:DNA-binding NarL/FixJ family response regulator